MNKWIITVTILILLLLFGVFLFVQNTNEQDLGENYFYLPKYEAIDIGYPEGAIIYKSAQKNVFTNVRIHGDVISVKANDDYIIAIQNTGINNTENKSLRYFIIEKKSDLMYGPYKKEEYLKKREELGIPKELQLEK